MRSPITVRTAPNGYAATDARTGEALLVTAPDADANSFLVAPDPRPDDDPAPSDESGRFDRAGA
jgi:hypothetical protein